MDMFDVLLQVGVLTAALVAYLIIFRRSSPVQFKGHYREPAWNYLLRLVCARVAVKRWKARRPPTHCSELPRAQRSGWEGVSFRGAAPDGSALLVAVRRLCGERLAELTVHVQLKDGTTYKLPQNPESALCPWEDIDNGWAANGLKIQVLEPGARLRILYNGLLTRAGDDTAQHVTFNLIWASASGTVRHPEDWSDELAARALALEPWRDDRWPNTLDRWGNGSWVQWGAVQGRFQSYDSQGAPDRSEYLRVRGVKERSWAPQGYQGLRRAVTITAAARDGTAVQLCGFSYREVLTLGFSGSVRFPDYTVESVTGTDLVMADFCESADRIPSTYTISVSTKKRDLKLVLRVNPGGGRQRCGVPRRHELVHRTLAADIDGECGAGFLELGYELSGISESSVHLPLPRALKWANEREAGVVGYCVPFESRAAACPNYVGGKGASLALLASVQREQGYRVPPGYCVTTLALEKHLETNPGLTEAIEQIQAATEHYEEKDFKEKCARAVELFAATEITGDLRDAILVHLDRLTLEATEQNLGPDLRFAVRSSAVGEDSEALSAAGQNATVLGCAGAGVLRAVQACWGSMFAFTSALYRRQNGQPCLCRGGVVMQALVAPRAAGVMFTRHPAAGDPTRLLITANYGLGESVVSGSVEPDTIVVSRARELAVSKIELGSKTQRVAAWGGGVAAQDVPEAERRRPCLSVGDALALAAVGVAQEALWGAPRDIEWAICEDEIFLLQARPITSLERWSEEELLHELDFPIMADDELTTFANAGEVMPRPLTPLTCDLVLEPLSRGINDIMYRDNKHYYDTSMVLTHNRCALCLYNSMYRRVPAKVDVTIRVLELCVHGHAVADACVLSTARRRRPPGRFDRLIMTLYTIKYLLTSKWSASDSVKTVAGMRAALEEDEQREPPVDQLQAIADVEPAMHRLGYNHANTTSASASSQLVAMLVLTEGEKEFTQEQCNEMNTLLSAGGVLSAEVPQALARLAHRLAASGRSDEFRAQAPGAAMRWLRDHLPEVHGEVCTFLEHHGHRAIMEFDLATKPWALVPEEMMQVLQNMPLPKEDTHIAKSNAEIIASLKTPKKSSTRTVLRWLLPLCQRTVRRRESTKAALVLGVHALRRAARRLARALLRQWYLPDEELVFYFRQHELREYILRRDPALLKKAQQRRQHFPAWCKLKFAEINTGWVQPLPSARPAVSASDARVDAASVCAGEVVARACVVKDLSEIGQLQRGDVLITHSTDIGWSPYFPLLSGVVTELGGLISHGAVIAREYGLPCIVGAVDATEIFKTGDTVRLCGAAGRLERVQLAEAAAPV